MLHPDLVDADGQAGETVLAARLGRDRALEAGRGVTDGDAHAAQDQALRVRHLALQGSIRTLCERHPGGQG
jgi:hypothetical protein